VRLCPSSRTASRTDRLVAMKKKTGNDVPGFFFAWRLDSFLCGACSLGFSIYPLVGYLINLGHVFLGEFSGPTPQKKRNEFFPVSLAYPGSSKPWNVRLTQGQG